MADTVANGVRFNTVVQRSDGRDRPAVVMLHGLVMDNLSSWYMTIAHPVAQHADVYLYDLRGHGMSERPAEGYTIADNVADLVALLDAWGVDRPVHLVGNSFGCVVALEVARRHPERVAGLVLIEAHYAVEGWGAAIAESLDRVCQGMSDEIVREYLATIAGRKFKKLVGNAEGLLLGTTIREDLRAEPGVPIEAFGEITTPAVALFGAESDILAQGRALADHMADCQLIVLDDCSHSLLMEAGPAVAGRVLDFLGADRSELIA